MKKPMMERAAEYRNKYYKKKMWQRVVSLMAAFVVFFTTYAMILPAITMEDSVFCGLEEHQHTEECYTMALACEWADMVVETPAPHEHSDACMVEHRELTCGLNVTEGKPAVTHAHTEACYSVTREQTCGQEATEGKSAVTHSHSAECYTVSREQICGKEESAGHAHTGECVKAEKVLICGNTEEGHVHADDCFKMQETYACGKSEGEGAHAHTEECYADVEKLTCGLEEGAVLEEAVPAHAHTDACYTETKTQICGLEEGAVVEEAIPGHAHTDECYTVTTTMECPQPAPTQEPEHVHAEECYEKVLVCTLTEHAHSAMCYSNPKADVEDASVWKRSVKGVNLTGEWAEDLIAIAESQIGYHESTRNYKINDEGKKKGYTRYGAWYGMPYEDWCAMFVSFCLNYAEVPKSEFPREASCARWIKELTDRGLYVSRSKAEPKPGDIVFFSWDGDNSADHVGIVKVIKDETIYTIEGNSANTVRTKNYSIDSGKILGYGIMPENPDFVKPTEEPTATVEATEATTEEPNVSVEPTEPTTEEPVESVEPTEAATEEPVESVEPTESTTEEPAVSVEPTEAATEEPIVSVEPTEPATEEPVESVEPTEPATEEPTVSVEPTESTTEEPAVSVEPTESTTEEPVVSVEPTESTTEEPVESVEPTEPATEEPTVSVEPTEPTTVEPAVSVEPTESTMEEPVVSAEPTEPAIAEPDVTEIPEPTPEVELGELTCGLEESEGHYHSVEAGCYKEVSTLACILSEDENHTHGADCYRTELTLVCELAESEGHHHTVACYGTAEPTVEPTVEPAVEEEHGELICGQDESEGHHHSAEAGCYKEVNTLICEMTEDETHTHSADCYRAELTLVCEIVESEGHHHTVACYGTAEPTVEPTVEPAVEEERGELICGQDESEGHHHSAEAGCYKEVNTLICEMTEDENHTHSTDCYRAELTLVCELAESEGHHHAAACYGDGEVVPEIVRGELTCGLEETEGHHHSVEAGCYKEIQTLACELTEDETHTHSADCYQTELQLVCTLEESDGHQHTFECYAPMLLMGSMNPMLAANAAPRIIAALPVTTIGGNGTTYDPATGNFTTELQINFDFKDSGITLDSLSEYTFTLPADVIVPENLITGGKKDFTDHNGNPAGQYFFTKDANGIVTVHATLNDTYLAAAGDVSGNIKFKGTLVTQTNDKGDIDIKAGDDVHIHIDQSDITFDGDETDKFDIDVSKSGNIQIDQDKLTYTVIVRSNKGTPDVIDLTDKLNTTELHLQAPTEVKVSTGHFEDYGTDVKDLEDWSAPQDYAYTFDPNENKLTLQLPKLEGGTTQTGSRGEDCLYGNCYKVTYVYDASELENVNVHTNNKVTVESKDKDSGQKVKKDFDYWHNINRAHTATKDGKYLSDQHKIEWTIGINSNQVDITDAVLTDAMLGDIANATQIEVTPNEEGIEWVYTDGKVTGIKFVQIAGKENHQSYTIKYYTEAKDGWEEQQILNEADFDPTPGTQGGEVDLDKTVTIPGGGVSKKFDSATVDKQNQTAEVQWTVTINVPQSGLAAPSTVTDTLSAGQWLTRNQISVWSTNMTWGQGQGGTSQDIQRPEQDYEFRCLEDGKWYPFLDIRNNTGGKFDNKRFDAIRISFPDGLASPNGKANTISFTYKSTANLADAKLGDNQYVNTVSVNDKTATAVYNYKKRGVFKTDGDGKTEDTAHHSAGDLYWYAKVITDEQDVKSLTVIDTLPEFVELKKLKLDNPGWFYFDVADDGTISGQNHEYQVDGKYDAATREVRVTVTRLDGNNLSKNTQYDFRFECAVNEDKLAQMANGDKLTLMNSVTVKFDEAEVPPSNQTQEWTYDKPTEKTNDFLKDGVWYNDDRLLKYTLEINPEGKDLLPGEGNTLTLIDELDYQSIVECWDSAIGANVNAPMEVSLLQGSVKLYYAKTDASGKVIRDENGRLIPDGEVPGWKWTFDWKETNPSDWHHPIRNTITGTEIPDGTPMVMYYNYAVTSGIPDTATNGNGLKISNKAWLEGTGASDSDDKTEEKWTESTSSGTVITNGTYAFYKVEKGNFNEVLKNAEFIVYRYDKEANAYDLQNPVKTYTTNEAGVFYIKMKEDGATENTYDYNTLYKVVEFNPPEGYLPPDPIVEYYFYFGNDRVETNNLPATLPDGAVDLSKGAHTAYVENAVNDKTTSITVNKKWFNQDGTEASAADTNGKKIIFDVYQIASETPPSGSGGGTGGSTGGGDTGGGSTGGGTTGGGSTGGEKVTYVHQNYGNLNSSGSITNAKIGSKIKVVMVFNDSFQYAVDSNYQAIEFTGATLLDRHFEYYDLGWGNKGTRLYECTAKVEQSEIIINAKFNKGDYTLSVDCIDPPDPDPVDPDPVDPDPVDPDPVNPDPPAENGTEYRKGFELSSGNGWSMTISDLPEVGFVNGKKVYYTYYVKERSVPNYETTYEGNDTANGIATGEITINNKRKKEDEPQVVLPNTGGEGTLRYTAGGMLLMGAAVILMYSNKKRKRRDGASWTGR